MGSPLVERFGSTIKRCKEQKALLEQCVKETLFLSPLNFKRALKLFYGRCVRGYGSAVARASAASAHARHGRSKARSTRYF